MVYRVVRQGKTRQRDADGIRAEVEQTIRMDMTALEFIEAAGLIIALVAVFLLVLKILDDLTFSRRRQRRECEVRKARRQVIKRLYLIAKQERSLGYKMG